MATKAERFKAEQQRAARANHTKRRPRRKAQKRRAPGAGNPIRPSRNAAPSAGRNSSYELEASASGRPSRKSSRKSATRVKTDAPLRIKTMMLSASPQARAVRDA
jgi:hypothetical protein